jgi:hypothetical protein
MRFELKRLSQAGVPAALRKAEHYRLLNEPLQAESICRDILEVEADNQQALITLVLALTDQFGDAGSNPDEARKLLDRVSDEYARMYYMGLVCERRATAYLERQAYGSGPIAYELFRKAMDWYESAAQIRPVDNEDALLRWNTCARVIMRNDHVRPEQQGARQPALE